MSRATPSVAATAAVIELDRPAPAEAPAAPAGRLGLGLLEALLQQPGRPSAPPAGAGAPGAPVERFLNERSVAAALDLWFGPGKAPASKRDLLLRLTRDIGRLDALVSEQLNQVLHRPEFQKLEASWRGLQHLVEQADAEDGVLFRVLNAPWRELARDMERAGDPEQSQLFRKVYTDEFDMPGGQPFGLLVGDYEIHPRPSAEHPVDDLAALRGIAAVAAAAFAPFVAAPHPSLLGLESFVHLERPLNLARQMDQADLAPWRSLREIEDARFVGLVLPRALLRLPYEDDGSRRDGFRFREACDGPGGEGELWGNAAYLFAGAAVRAFAASGWPADIRGVHRDPPDDADGGGLIRGLPPAAFTTDGPGVAVKCLTDVVITDQLEKDLADLGLIGLCHCKDTSLLAFYSSSSVQKPKAYNAVGATTNARISAMIQYMLCASRFAHYLKVQVRNKVGSMAEPQQLQDFLNRWLSDYITNDDNAPPAVKARFPLRAGEAEVRERPDAPGSYLCVMRLWPHFQLDALAGTLHLKTQLAAPAGR